MNFSRVRCISILLQTAECPHRERAVCLSARKRTVLQLVDTSLMHSDLHAAEFHLCSSSVRCLRRGVPRRRREGSRTGDNGSRSHQQTPGCQETSLLWHLPHGGTHQGHLSAAVTWRRGVSPGLPNVEIRFDFLSIRQQVRLFFR